MNFRAQAGLEYLIIMAFVIAISGTLVSVFTSYDPIQIALAQISGEQETTANLAISPEDCLSADVTGDSVVNSFDLTAVRAMLGCDFNSSSKCVKSDVTQNFAVDSADLDFVSSQLGCQISSPECLIADVTGDGVVSFWDISFVRAQFGCDVSRSFKCVKSDVTHNSLVNSFDLTFVRARLGCTSAFVCSDSDGGINLEVLGTCTDGNGSQTDSCYFDSGNILEAYCNSSTNTCVKAHNYCPSGTFCTNGACVAQQQACGNNVIEGTEICDGSDLAGQTCVTQGFTGGTLTCKADCAGFDTSACTNYVEMSYTMTDSNYPLKSGSGQGNHEFVRELTNNQLPNLTNQTKTYTYNGSSYGVVMYEKIVIDVDAKFDKSAGVKDLSAFIYEGGYKYVLQFADGTKNGLPAFFVDDSLSSIVIPFLGKNYKVESINKGAVPAKIVLSDISTGQQFLLYDGKEYPYTGDTNYANDYWKVQLDFNSQYSSVPGGETLQRITIKNAVKVWDSLAGNPPLFAGSQSLLPEHQDSSLQEAKFLEGLGIPSTTPGYNFASLKFNGFKNLDLNSRIIGKPSNCFATGMGASSGCVMYKDVGNIERTIPMYYELGLNTGSTWSSFYISNETFWYRCSMTDVNIALSKSTPSYLNGELLYWSSDKNLLLTDFGYSDVSKPYNIGKSLVLSGVTYKFMGFSPNYVTLMADGNCQFTSTDPNTTLTPIGMGTGTPLNKTIFYSDINGARFGMASHPLLFTASALTDTYKYAYTANESTGRVYLLLDNSTDFGSAYVNLDLNLLGTDVAEVGLVSSARWPIAAHPKFRPYYLPDIQGLGGYSGDNSFYTAQFAVDVNGGIADVLVNIDTATGKPIALPNNNLSIWNSDVNALPNQSQALWTLSTSTASGTELKKAYLDNGAKFELDADKVTISTPVSQRFLKLIVTARTG